MFLTKNSKYSFLLYVIMVLLSNYISMKLDYKICISQSSKYINQMHAPHSHDNSHNGPKWLVGVSYCKSCCIFYTNNQSR